MNGSMILIHIAIATTLVVVAVMALKLEPVISLILGAIYLGLVSGQGAMGTIETITGGFADVMGKIGLLIAFGVLLGSLMQALGVPQRIADHLLRVMGRRAVPYAYGLTLGGLLASVYADVLLVLCGPLTKHAGVKLGRNGHGLLSGTAIIGIAVGLNFVVPGTGLMAVVGVLGVPLQSAFLYALPMGLLTIVLTVFVYVRLIGWNLWNESKDQKFDSKTVLAEDQAVVSAQFESARVDSAEGSIGASGHSASAGRSTTVVDAPNPPRERPLRLLFSPLALTVGMLLVSALADAVGLRGTWTDIVGNPNAALFAGLCLSYVIARSLLSTERLSEAVRQAMHTSGSILVLTGVSGGLAAVVKGTDVGDAMGALFSGGGAMPLLLTWAVAAAMHMAVGSMTLGAVTAAGILAPFAVAAGPQGAVLIALAALSGGMFVALPNANGFWLFRAMFDLTTTGTLKTYTLAPTLASIISLVLLVLLDIVV